MKSFGVNASRGFVGRSGEDDASMTKEGAAQRHKEIVDEHCLAAATAAASFCHVSADSGAASPLAVGWSSQLAQLLQPAGYI